MNFRVPGPVSSFARANVKFFCQIQVNERASGVSFLLCLRDAVILQNVNEVSFHRSAGPMSFNKITTRLDRFFHRDGLVNFSSCRGDN